MQSQIVSSDLLVEGGGEMAKRGLTREERDGRELLRHTLVQLTLQMKDQWRLKQQNPQDNQVKICIYVHLRISYI